MRSGRPHLNWLEMLSRSTTWAGRLMVTRRWGGSTAALGRMEASSLESIFSYVLVAQSLPVANGTREVQFGALHRNFRKSTRRVQIPDLPPFWVCERLARG